MPWRRERLPRLPVFGWEALSGPRAADTPCLLDLPNLRYTTSGRASILLALESLGIGPGDEVLLPTFHCPTMVAPAVSLGAVARFYALDARGSPNLAALSGLDLRRVRVMLVAHFFGLPQPMGPVRRWCQDQGILLIEDCAHALFGLTDGRPVGSWGDLAIGSLTKFLPVREGGCVVVNGRAAPVSEGLPRPVSDQLRAVIDVVEVGAAQGRMPGLNAVINFGLQTAHSLRRPPSHADAAPVEATTIGSDASGSELKIDSQLAHGRLTIASRWLAQALPRKRVVDLRRANYALLARLLEGQAGLRPLFPALADDCAPYVFPLWVQEPDPGYLELRRRQVPVFRWDRLWPGTPRAAGDHGPLWSHHVLQLACHQDLAPAQIEALANAVLAVYGGRPASEAGGPGQAARGPHVHPPVTE